MFRGFYTVATGMIAQQRRTELLSNNLANANTPGFKAEQSTIRSFPDMLLSSIGGTNASADEQSGTQSMNQVGVLNTGVYMQETIPNYVQGQIYSTDLSTDMALIDGNLPRNENGVTGSIFFRLQYPTGGEAYTRNGNFTLDGQGYLVNAQGLYVLADTGERIQLQNDDFQLTQDGYIVANNQQVARVGVAYAENPNLLQKQDNGVLRLQEDGTLPNAFDVEGVNFSLRQNYLEGSNVDASRTMTELMTAYRAFEANQKILQAYDRSMDKAVNEIGKI